MAIVKIVISPSNLKAIAFFEGLSKQKDRLQKKYEALSLLRK